jgi:tetratricopeptide (TPR) repeat protein
MRSEADAYSAYESLLVRLHELDRLGGLESEEAEFVRDQMDEPWARLGRFERERLANLSADLTQATGPGDRSEPSVARDERSALLVQARNAYAERRWDDLLRTLRSTSDLFPPALVAYMRGRCWAALGRPDAAYRFFEDAHLAEPGNVHYELLALDALFRSTQRDQAVQRASAVIARSDAEPQLIFGAAKVLTDAAHSVPVDQSRQLYEQIVPVLRAALSKLGAPSIRSLVLVARLNLAIALERLGRDEEAQRAYAELVTHHPDSEEALLARALFLLPRDRPQALLDLRALIDRNTSLVHPYLFAAHDALGRGDFSTCLVLTERALRLAHRPELQATLLEWMAISLFKLKAELGLVRGYFQDAIGLDPLNENIRHNFELVERAPGVEAFQTPMPVEAGSVIHDLQERLQPAA